MGMQCKCNIFVTFNCFLFLYLQKKVDKLVFDTLNIFSFLFATFLQKIKMKYNMFY